MNSHQFMLANITKGMNKPSEYVKYYILYLPLVCQGHIYSHAVKMNTVYTFTYIYLCYKPQDIMVCTIEFKGRYFFLPFF